MMSATGSSRPAPECQRGGLQRPTPSHPAPRALILDPRYFFNQSATLPGFALTQVSAALSGFIFLPETSFTTVFWSSDVHVNFRFTKTAGEPLFANLLLIA